MAHFQSWACPDCGGKFRHLHHPDDAPPPDRCPLCDAWLSDAEPTFIPQAPAVRSGVAQAVDDVYRGTEDSSRLRTEMMAQIGGGSASDYAHTIVTNMKDNQKPGDIAYVAPPPNPVTQVMAATPNLTGHQQNALAFAEANRVGVGAYAGERARQATVAQHRQQVQALVGAGQLASYSGKK
jgi:hypothetical protein